MDGLVRFVIGAVGGLTASLSKILAIDVEKLADFLERADLASIDSLRVQIFIFTPILMVIGGIVAWATNENVRMKLLAIGCAGPALIAPWTTASIDTDSASNLAPTVVSTANAQTTDGEQDEKKLSKYTTGIKVLLGIEDEKSQKYWVIVGSSTSYDDAKAQANAINNSNPELAAFVGKRKPDNEQYPVIVGGPAAFLPYADAQKLRSKAVATDIISQDVFLSNYAGRAADPVAEAPE